MSQAIDAAVATKVKLCALWTSIVFCLIYTEYFRLHRPAALEQMKAFGASPEYQMAALVMVAIPILMIFLSAALPAKVNRILNIVLGLAFVLLWALSTLMISGLASALNVTLTLSAAKILQIAVAAFAALVVWYAWKWPSAL